MADFSIKKRVSLEFLGDEYKESYLLLKAIPVDEYDKLIEDAESAASKKQSVKFIQSVIKERFIEGKISEAGGLQDVSGEDLGQFPAEVFIAAYQEITGQVSPKA